MNFFFFLSFFFLSKSILKSSACTLTALQATLWLFLSNSNWNTNIKVSSTFWWTFSNWYTIKALVSRCFAVLNFNRCYVIVAVKLILSVMVQVELSRATCEACVLFHLLHTWFLYYIGRYRNIQSKINIGGTRTSISSC